MDEKEYIERKKVIKMANELYVQHLTMQSHTVGDAIQDFIQSVRKAPAADVVEVRHGYWDDNIIGFCNVCMECGAIVERTAVRSHTGALNYCPNCGAKMYGKDLK